MNESDDDSAMSPARAPLAAAAADPLEARLQNLIGLRPGAISALRLRHAAREIAAVAGVAPDRLPALLAMDARYRQELVDRVTVQESQFFRDAPFFAALANVVLPSLRDPVTVWSAGCANGQETYSVGMLLAETGHPDWRVLGSDVSGRALRVARDARYSDHDLRGLSSERRRRFLRADGEAGFTIAQPLRDRIDFVAHNLVRPALPAAAADTQLVLLRNVLIYFDEPSARAVLSRLAAALRPGAWILLGGSEVLHPIAGLTLVRAGSIYAYRVPDAAPTTAGRFTPAADRAAAHHTQSDAVAAGQTARREELLAAGERRAATGDHAEAIRCFRQLVLLDGDDATARLRLALSLDSAGEIAAASRAFRATLTVLAARRDDDCDTVDGYRVQDVVALVRERLEALGCAP